MEKHQLESPVDLPAEPIEEGHPFRWTLVTIATASIVLLFANAATLSAWVDEKPPSKIQLIASDVAGRWAHVMDAIGITAPRRELHELWKKAQAARFADEAPAQGQ